MTRKIGYFSEKIIKLLGLSILPGTPILIGDSNIKHIKDRHPYEYEQYFSDIESILLSPDYVGINKRNGSIDFVKEYIIAGDHIQVSVRVNPGGAYYARTMFALMSYKLNRSLANGSLLPVP